SFWTGGRSTSDLADVQAHRKPAVLSLGSSINCHDHTMYCPPRRALFVHSRRRLQLRRNAKNLSISRLVPTRRQRARRCKRPSSVMPAGARCCRACSSACNAQGGGGSKAYRNRPTLRVLIDDWNRLHLAGRRAT